MQRWSRLLEDIPSNGLVFEHHFNQGTQADHTLRIHTALSLIELAQESISDALDASTLELTVLITDQIDELYAVLLLSTLKVWLGKDLWDTEDPLETRHLERVVNLEELTDLLK